MRIANLVQALTMMKIFKRKGNRWQSMATPTSRRIIL